MAKKIETSKKTVKKSTKNIEKSIENELINGISGFKFFTEKDSNNKFKNPFVQLFREHLPKQIVFIALIVLLMVFILLHIKEIGSFFSKFVSILMPIISGWILTYLMAPLYNMLINRWLIVKEGEPKYRKKYRKFAKPFATFVCLIVVLAIGAGLIFLVVPQLLSSIRNFGGKAEGYLNTLRTSIESLKNTSDNDLFKQFFSMIENGINEALNKSKNMNFVDYSKIFVFFSSSFSVLMKTILNIFVGIVVMLYSLNLKTELLNGCKRIMFAICEKTVAKKVLVEIRYAHKVFSGFLVGKLVDSLIIGILCYICCFIMKMPYAPLVSVVVGVTNIIPFFGPFIGAIPSFLIIFLEEPFGFKSIGFLIFIFALQQLDGNVIGPKILGDKTGVAPFWVLFSILLFGGLFGFIGMIIAVPMWAVITRLFEEFVTIRLAKKGYPLTVDDYQILKEYNNSLQAVHNVENKK